MSGYPLHRENRENGQKIPCQGKHRKFGNFVKTQGKTQGILLAQVVNALILKVPQVSFVYVIVTNYVNWHRESLRLDRENTGNLKIQFDTCMTIFDIGTCFLPMRRSY